MLSINVKRILSLLLVAVLLLGQCPLAVLATDDTETTVTESVDMETIASGEDDPFTSYQEQIDAIVMMYLGKTQADQAEIWAAVEPMDFETYQTARCEINILLDEIIEAGKSGILSEERIQQFEMENETFLNLYLALEEKNCNDENRVSFLDGSSSGTLSVTGGSLGWSGSWTTTIIVGQTKNYGNVTASGSGTSATITIQSDRKGKTTTATLTNSTGDTKELCFTYTTSNGTATFPSDATAVNGSFSMVMANNQTITITFQPSSYSEGTVTLSNIELKTVASGYDVTVSTIGSGTVTADQTITNGVISAVSPTDGVTLTASPGTGATFLGWIDPSTKQVLNTSASYLLKPSAATTVQAVFADSSKAWFLVPSGTSSYMYDDLNEAGTKASTCDKKVIPAADGTLPAGNYTIPAGVTLLIPYDAANTLCTEKPTITESNTTPSVYRMLTMASGAHIAVNGAISVGGQQYCSRPIGAVSGKYGVIEMAEGSSITVNDGGFLYAWGYIAGVKGSNTTVSEGTVTIESGGTVYEDFQIVDWRGGTATTTMISDETVFPMSQYYVQNVQVPMTLKSGATENTFTSVKVTLAGIQDAPVTFIGEGGMFVLDENTSVIKDYNEATDRLTLELVQGSISLGSVQMELKVSTLGGKININSANFVLPLNNNITIIANSGTTLSAVNDVAMLPGSEMILKEGSNFNITSGSYYIYDLDEWTYDTTSADMITKLDGNTYNNGGYCSEYNWVMAAAPYAHDRIKTRAAADLKDAEVKVDGTITVSDGAYVYTTAGGANVYSTGTGKIEFKGAPGTATTTYQAVATTEDRTGVAYVEIPITSAKLKNADGSYVATADESGTYTYYASTGRWDRPSHFYEAVVTPPSCTEAGSTTYTCSVCGDSYSETIAATGHSYEAVETPATCIKDGYTTYTCSCGHVYVENFTGLADHNYVDGVCTVCGLGEGALTIDYVSLSMENSLEMNFAFLKSGISDPSGCYVKFTKVNEDGKTTATTKAYDTWKSVTIGDKEYWYAVYSGLAAKEMSDMVYAGVYDSSNNLISQVKADSIQTQAMRNLETAKDKTLTRTMVVDMLNYGAAAQQKFNYHTNNLANSQLTDEQKAWATDSANYDNKTPTTPEGVTYMATVKLESNIQFMIAIFGLTDGMDVEITFYDHYGTDKSYTLENITIESDDGYFYHTVEQTVIADAWEDITITVKDGETVVATITDNIASYAARAMNKTGNELYEMIVKFSHSAKAYLHDKYNITEG